MEYQGLQRLGLTQQYWAEVDGLEREVIWGGTWVYVCQVRYWHRVGCSWAGDSVTGLEPCSVVSDGGGEGDPCGWEATSLGVCEAHGRESTPVMRNTQAQQSGSVPGAQTRKRKKTPRIQSRDSRIPKQTSLLKGWLSTKGTFLYMLDSQENSLRK